MELQLVYHGKKTLAKKFVSNRTDTSKKKKCRVKLLPKAMLREYLLDELCLKYSLKSRLQPDYRW